jgi:hypothetical protein
MVRPADDGGGLATVPSTVPLLAGALPALPEAVPAVRHAVVTFARAHGAGGALLGHIKLAVSEVVANAVQHAYEPGTPGLVHVTADVEHGALEIVVADDGRGFRPGETNGLGVGLPAVAGVTADSAITQRFPHGTEVWMRFLLPA